VLLGLPVGAAAAPAPQAAAPAPVRVAAAPTAPGPLGVAATPVRTVSYGGIRLRVPASWPVVDLDRSPQSCVRFDVHAVYLGAAGPDQACPARVVGRTETVWVAPVGRTGLRAAAAVAGAVPVTAVDTVDQQVTVDPVGTGVTVTATWGADPALARRIVASGTRGPVVRRTAPLRGMGVVTKFPIGATATPAAGYGFDACAAPSVTVMNAWRSSPFGTVGVYIGGLNRGCAQPNLTQPWVSAVMAGQGWRTLPLYVGRQAPCVGRSDLGLIDPGRAFAQGTEAARDAIGDARRIGLRPGSALYNDMEGYPRGGACTAAVLNFLSGWTNQLHEGGWLSGVYSSASGAIADLASAAKPAGYTAPDVIWTARWDNWPQLFGEPYVADSRWAVAQRVKQYLGDHVERWGGYSLNIDSNRVDAPGGTIAYLGRFRASVWTRWAPSNAAAAGGLLRAGQLAYYSCVIGGQVVGGSPRWVRLVDGRFVPAAGLTPARGTPFCSLPGQVDVDLNMRNGPSSAGPVRGVLPRGALAAIACQRTGELVGDSRVWDRLTNGLYVSDRWVATPGRPGFSPTIPRC